MMRCAICEDLHNKCKAMENSIDGKFYLVCPNCEYGFAEMQDSYWEGYYNGIDDESY